MPLATLPQYLHQCQCWKADHKQEARKYTPAALKMKRTNFGSAECAAGVCKRLVGFRRMRLRRMHDPITLSSIRFTVSVCTLPLMLWS